MGINRMWLKESSRTVIRKSKTNFLLSGLAYVMMLYIISILCMYLSGYGTMVEQAMEQMEKGAVLTYEDMLAMMPSVSPVAIVLVIVNMLLSVLIQSGYQGYCLMDSRGIPVVY